MSPNGKVAVVTGGGTGIGKSAALALVADGYSVAVSGRRLEPLESTKAEAGDAGSRVLPVQTDVGDPAAVKALFAKTKEAYGRLDVLFKEGMSKAEQEGPVSKPEREMDLD